MTRRVIGRAPAPAHAPATAHTASAMLAIAAVAAGLALALPSRRGTRHLAARDTRGSERAAADTLEDALRAATEERALIARELHDVLGHSLGVIIVQAGAAAQLVDDDPAAARAALESIRRTGTRSLDEMREVLAALRGRDLTTRCGLADLPLLAEGSSSGTLTVEYAERGCRPPLGPAAQLALYRIAQEALTNVHRHAAARTARIEVAHTQDAVHLSIADDGLGGPRTALGSGIRGMHERAALHGGTVLTGPPADGRGWLVEARLPVGGPG